MPATVRCLSTSALAVALGGLAGCAALGGAPPAEVAPPLPPAWNAPLPHAGQRAELARWWQQLDDPLLSRLVDAAQELSPTVAAARTRIEQARATRTAAAAALVPAVDANASVNRGRQDVSLPEGTLASAALQATWEIDLFGRNRAATSAAEERLAGASAGWHEARVAVAAEVATRYTSLRACEARVVRAELDAASRAETARATELAASAGFQPPAGAALARASAAQGRVLVEEQRLLCELDVKALVALTGFDEPGLRQALAPAAAQVPKPAALDVPAVPAAALAQRPDIYTAAREVAAASADVRQADAARWPRITLAGSIGAARFDSSQFTLNESTWSIGPVSVTVPLFDGGTRRANAEAARVRYDEAVAAYAGRLRTAVREVEEALVTLQSTGAREGDAERAVADYAYSLRAADARYRGGLANLFELEDARRSALTAQVVLIDLQRERVGAWIQLYRALGGGWQAPESLARADGAVAGATR